MAKSMKAMKATKARTNKRSTTWEEHKRENRKRIKATPGKVIGNAPGAFSGASFGAELFENHNVFFARDPELLILARKMMMRIHFLEHKRAPSWNAEADPPPNQVNYRKAAAKLVGAKAGHDAVENDFICYARGYRKGRHDEWLAWWTWSSHPEHLRPPRLMQPAIRSWST